MDAGGSEKELNCSESSMKEENPWMGRAGPQARTIACPCQQDGTTKTSLCPREKSHEELPLTV